MTERHTYEVRVIFRHRKARTDDCPPVWSALLTQTVEARYRADGRFDSYSRDGIAWTRQIIANRRCPSCGDEAREHHEVKGQTNETKCDARCTGARGHSCECQCGGKNHGADWSAA